MPATPAGPGQPNSVTPPWNKPAKLAHPVGEEAGNGQNSLFYGVFDTDVLNAFGAHRKKTGAKGVDISGGDV